MDIIIKNENDAWKYLELLTSEKLKNDVISLKFEGWPSLELTVKGRDFQSSMPTRIMPPILDLQREVHKTYCLLRYGTDNTRKLTNDDRERLEIVVKVDPGSSIFKALMEKSVNEIVESVENKMESKHLMVVLIIAILSWTSGTAWKVYVDSQAREKEVDAKVKLAKIEHDRQKLLTNIISNDRAAEKIQLGSNEFKNHTMHRLKESDELIIKTTGKTSALSVSGDIASQITYKPRRESIDIRIDGEFLILSVDSGRMDGYRLKVQRISDGKEIIVKIPDMTLSLDQLETIQKCEWGKQKLLMSINAKQLDNEIRNATLVSVSAIQSKN